VAAAAGSAGSRGRRRVDELLVPPRRRSTNDAETRRSVSASPVDDVITLIQVTKAVFDLTESRFRFIVNPDLDSLANRMVWIRGCCRK